MKKFGNALWGLVLIVIGLIIGGNALGITNINIFFDGWWTLFIIVPCFIGLFNENEKTGNIIGLLIGVVLFLGCQNIIRFELIWKLAFPTILVIIGLSIIFKDTLNGKVNKEIKKLNEKRTGENTYCATFSGEKSKINSGIGATSLELTGEKEDYTINASKGLGNLTLDGQELESDKAYGNLVDKNNYIRKW